jgi:hypothetical protein
MTGWGDQVSGNKRGRTQNGAFMGDCMGVE